MNLMPIPKELWNLSDKVAGALDVAKQLEDIGFVAGSVARYLVLGPEMTLPSDIDVWLYNSTEQTYCSAISRLQDIGYVMGDINAASARMEKPGQLPVEIILPMTQKNGYKRVTYGTVYEVLKFFDFTVNQAALYANPFSKELELVAEETLISDGRARRLNPVYFGDPYRYLYRIQKYAQKGYRMDSAGMGAFFHHVHRAFQGLEGKEKGPSGSIIPAIPAMWSGNSSDPFDGLPVPQDEPPRVSDELPF